ncbi:TPA: type II toxin-antitoxin system HicB family antitoxin [Mannheimia haemolytica]|nr:type II toxin-antitoxin system HicB family antitoxin [Mannheimia haemolytica]HDZ6813887.1 type II toxin-antitoxin system HicB family antitoxin [Mannheimia haemolytica]
MIFTVGVETPDNENQAYGMIVPALCQLDYGCFSGADEVEDLLPMATEAITMMIESMVENGFDLTTLKDKGVTHYRNDPEYAAFDTWLLVDIDLSEYLGQKQRINITMPQFLLNRIDRRVAAMGNFYKDRSHFLATAAHRELHAHSNTEM